MRQSPKDPTSFPVGTYVLVAPKPTALGGRPLTKTHPRRQGPYVVVNVNGDKYTCRNLVTEACTDFHISRLREFFFDADIVNPQEVALRDTEEFYIERILEHRGDVKRLRSLEFKVRWLGYDSEHDSWEPWKAVRATEKLHQYLIASNLHKIIPRNFRENYPARSGIETVNALGVPTRQVTSTLHVPPILIPPGKARHGHKHVRFFQNFMSQGRKRWPRRTGSRSRDGDGQLLGHASS